GGARYEVRDHVHWLEVVVERARQHADGLVGDLRTGAARVIREQVERDPRALRQHRMDRALAAQALAYEIAAGEQPGDVGRRDERGTRDEVTLEILRCEQGSGPVSPRGAVPRLRARHRRSHTLFPGRSQLAPAPLR